MRAMKKKTAIIAFIIVFAGFALISTLGLRNSRLQSVKRLVSHNVRVGEPFDEVSKFLDANQLEHSEIRRLDAMRIDGRDYGKKDVILATKRNTWRNAFKTQSIMLVFVFDEDGHLTRWDIFPVYTGL